MLMPFADAKVYYDGSHYIAIPHTKRPNMKYREQTIEEQITVVQEQVEGSETQKVDEPFIACKTSNIASVDKDAIYDENESKIGVKTEIQEQTMTRKQLFDKLYMEHIDLPKKQRAIKIMEEMQPYFDSIEELKWYVDLNMERKARNITARRVRMVRKAHLAQFNYFVTFTYDGKKHTEQTFKKKLRTCLRHLTERKGWRYMGVWERAPKTNRLHFHGLFCIPDINFLDIQHHKDYDTTSHKMQDSYQSTYFNTRFGRSDFKEISANKLELDNELSYLFKYIEKMGEKIVYSKNLPQFFISDIFEEDIICRIGQENKKLLLYDDFDCWKNGEYMGKVGNEIINKMEKLN